MMDNELKHNMVSVGWNKFNVEGEGIYLAFYNEDDQGNDQDIVPITITKHCAESLVEMLKNALKPV